MKPIRHLFLAAALLAGVSAISAQEVNLYSQRHYETDKALYELFTKETGIKVNVVQASADQLMERLRAEGAGSPADVFMTADAGRLQRAHAAGLLQPVLTPTLERQVPAAFRDRAGHWHGITVRGRVIIYHRERVPPSQLSTYADLADPKWKGRLLLTSSSSPYNQSLLAAQLAARGEKDAAAWVRGIVANLARAPQGGDRDQARAIVAGLADVAIVNTYYMGLLRASPDAADRKVGEAVGVFFPDQSGAGAHVNLSGAGLVRHAKNRDHAIKLLEFLTGPEAQRRYSAANHEYPLSLDSSASPALQAFGPFKPDTKTLPEIGRHQEAAARLATEAGWR